MIGDQSSVTGDLPYLLGGTAESPDLGGVVAANGAGVGDYYEDADCYLRNELAELQITSADKLPKAVEQMPKNVRANTKWPSRPTPSTR